ncbi:MAG TPA: hypothetical protein VMV49_13260, partial [Candidatus Deferrimicrobium sp.]|nr:hypothetical protein [Candidatus Deferrimicrobium sp.]
MNHKTIKPSRILLLLIVLNIFIPLLAVPLNNTNYNSAPIDSNQLYTSLTVIKVQVFDKQTNDPIPGASVQYINISAGEYISGETNT